MDNMKTQIFVGAEAPSEKHIRPIRNNEMRSKPKGGIWTSPETENGKSEFMMFEGGDLVKQSDVVWRLHPRECQILHIGSVEKLEKLPSIEDRGESRYTYLDFEAIFERGYDGIHITRDVIHKKRFSSSYSLLGWDIETYLWCNLDWIGRVERVGKVEEIL